MELAWAAGFFDGEGCASVHQGKYLRMNVSQSDPRPLRRFAIVAGVGAVNGPYEQGGHGNKARYEWTVCGKKAEVVADMLLPFLSEPKQEQIAKARQTLNGGDDA